MNSNLKIAIGTDAFPPTTDGISNVAQNYAKVLNEKYCKASVITPKNPNAKDGQYPYEIFRYKSWWVPSKEGYSVGWPFSDKLHYEIINRHFDLLHSHAPLATSYYFRCVNRKKRIPTVLTYHTKYEYDVDLRVPTQYGKDFAYRFLLNNINAADEVWLTSEGSIESLRKFGYEGDYIVMPNGCDLPKRDFTDVEINALKMRYNIPRDIPVFIYAGRMIWYKNIKSIFEACKILKDYGEDFRLILLGFGADEKEIKRLYRNLNLDDKIVWTGKILDREDLQKHYAAADMLLFPSTFDTNGLVVREAASCKTPSLLIDGSCAAENIVDGVTGFLCDDTSKAIAERVKSVMHKKQHMANVGKNAQNDIYISWDDIVGKAFERYQIVIDNFYSSGKDKEPFKY